MNKNKININSNSKIYVAIPARVNTGGPELLHQLVFILRNKFNINAFVFYFPNNHESPVHPEYQVYNVPFVTEIEDSKDNILIAPEITEGVSLFKNFTKIRKIIWWLSVDNFFTSRLYKNKKFLFLRVIDALARKMMNRRIVNVNQMALKEFYSFSSEYKKQIVKKIDSEIDYHFVQSYYALNFLLAQGIDKNKIFYLSDYINEKYLLEKVDVNKKEDIVVYNPQKGFDFTRRLINSQEEIKFMPITNMTRNQVIELLKKAKVYIDFGNHPGKDRIPREAAILKCCVIVGRRGAANNSKDVPIPIKYKFKFDTSQVPKIINMINLCFKNYKKCINDFNSYRKLIKSEPNNFIRDISNIFEVKN